MASVSPNLSSFPLSSSRGTRQLPTPQPLCTQLPPLTPASLYHQTRQPSLSNEPLFGQSQHYSVENSYFTPTHSNPSSMPSSTASTPAPTSAIGSPDSPQPRRSIRGAATKRTSISSLLSAPDNSSGNDSSSPSSPTYHWSGSSSPTTAGTTRSNSVVNTPVIGMPHSAGACFSTVDYDLTQRDSIYGGQDEDTKLYTVGAVRTKKGRNSPRAVDNNNSNNNNNRDEYDVLGRKKPKTPRTPMSWDPKDDTLLKQLKEEQRLGWKEIATHFRGRTSHACQFRWRRLASGQLKYYQGHRRPPPVTTTSASFANEMASTATTGTMSSSPKILMNGMHSVSPSASTPRALHAIPHMSPTSESSLPPLHHPSLYPQVVQPNWGQSASLYQPTPLPSPTAYSPRFMVEDYHPWSEQEDGLLLNRKLSFDEVNVLLPGRSEIEIWNRMVKLRQNEMHRPSLSMPMPMHCMAEARREAYEDRIPGIGSVAALGYHTASR
ncbi:hypothetical protein FN846DRAFT_902647 [Sphaerosporella brunnea]|uniref:Uncharacterized protein n=1 Tax=Sphaerosporella brunnea TaxID=1250544 RepID=A0A5J5F9Q5_9PEZI|nr:hypothetical protein FN846DRAFT_902647 [Sphaerosporella brunnea]